MDEEQTPVVPPTDGGDNGGADAPVVPAPDAPVDAPAAGDGTTPPPAAV